MSSEMRVIPLTEFSEEVIAVLFAQYSRSEGTLADSIAAIRKGDAEAKAGEFHEKWVLGFGHSSVAEHAVVHLGVENISILAAKAIEDTRLGSYTEKSTRYVKFALDNFVRFVGEPKEYSETCRMLMAEYGLMREIVLAHAHKIGLTGAKANTLALDTVRGLLPASTKTHLGLTMNARSMARNLSKLIGHPLSEVRDLGDTMQEECLKLVPTLVRHVEPSEPQKFHFSTHNHSAKSSVCLMRRDTDALQRVVMAARAQGFLGDSDERTIHYAAKRGEHEALPRCFEFSNITASVVMDYGAFRDLQRHRVTSCIAEPLSCENGWSTPELISELGLGQRWHKAMSWAASTRDKIQETHGAYTAQYVCPLAFNVGVLWQMNLRELAHIVELRTKPTCHVSYKNVVMDLYRAVLKEMPWLYMNGCIRVEPTLGW